MILLLAVWLLRRRTRHSVYWRVGRWLAYPLLALFILPVWIAIVLIWYGNRPLPAPVSQRPLHPGIVYSREIRHQPHPLVIHQIRVDLTTPGLDLFITPPTPTDGYSYRARTTSQFLDEFDLQLAINAGPFAPWRSRTPWDYYPRAGDGVNPLGVLVHDGIVSNKGDQWGAIPVYITPDNRVTLKQPPPGATTYDAVSGLGMLVYAGQIIPQNLHPLLRDNREPRTALGLDESGDILTLVVVDGRQPNYSEGLSLPDLAGLMLDFGVYHAVNLDGGGSSTLVVENDDGEPDVLNSPIQARIPGWERPIATHFGVRLGD